MTPDFDIIDCHGHIFPPLAGACGFPSAADHLLQQQRAMHVHGNQPYRRLRDHALVGTRDLWNADDHSEAGRTQGSGFRPSSPANFRTMFPPRENPTTAMGESRNDCDRWETTVRTSSEQAAE